MVYLPGRMALHCFNTWQGTAQIQSEKLCRAPNYVEAEAPGLAAAGKSLAQPLRENHWEVLKPWPEEPLLQEVQSSMTGRLTSDIKLL